MKVAIIGRTQILYETTIRLRQAGHAIVCVVTSKAAPEYSRNEKDFERLATECGAEYFLTNTLNKPEIETALSGADIGVSTNWVSVITQKHIDLFRHGILNSHTGDLPRYRGNACANWALLSGDDRITNTIHFMEGGKLDCGRIICQDHLAVENSTTIADVYRWTEETLPALYEKALALLEKDPNCMMKYADPDDPDGFRCYPRLPEDGFIDWTRSANDVHNLVRAVTTPFAGAYTYHLVNDEVKKLVVLESRVVEPATRDRAMPGHVLENNADNGESLVRCGEGVIALRRCRYEGEEDEFSPGKRWKSIRMRLGVRAEDWLWAIQQRKRIEQNLGKTQR